MSNIYTFSTNKQNINCILLILKKNAGCACVNPKAKF